MSPRFKRSLKGWWCIHVFQRVGECVFSFSLHHPARCFFFCSCKMHVFFLCFSVFLNVILVSYKSEIAFQPLAPGVFLSQPRFFFFYLPILSVGLGSFFIHITKNYVVLLNSIHNGMASYRNIWVVISRLIKLSWWILALILQKMDSLLHTLSNLFLPRFSFLSVVDEVPPTAISVSLISRLPWKRIELNLKLRGIHTANKCSEQEEQQNIYSAFFYLVFLF